MVADYTFKVPITSEMVEPMANVRPIAQPSTGYDHIDIAAFGAAGMTLNSDGKLQEASEFLLKKSDRPLIVDLRVDPEDLPPLNMQGSLMF